MKNNAKRIICLILAVILVAVTFSSCSGKEKMIDFIYPFSADVNSFDPQVAGTTDEYLIIENTFEGLIRIDDDGTVKKGVADSWEISDDGLTYVFHLKQGLKWDIDTEKYTEGDKKGEFKDERLQMLGREFNPDITAHDFVFALRRACAPETDCPLFSLVSSIKNANAVHSGKMKRESLGVAATDDYTLTITLAYPDGSFMESLTSAAAMPCNEEFFNATKGRYGLLTKYTLFNGQFYLSQILEASYLLKKNEQYLGDFPASAKELTLKITEEDDKTVDKLLSGYYDAAFIQGVDSSKVLKSNTLTTKPYNNTTWALRFNTNSVIFSNKTMRKAFCLGVQRPEAFDEKYLSSAAAMVPSSCKLGANNAIEAMGQTVPNQNQKESIKQWKKGLKSFDITDFTIKIITTPEMENALKEVLQGVQGGIGTVVRNDDGDKIYTVFEVETMTEAEMNTAIIKGEYDIAMCPFKASSDSATSFLRYVEDNAGGFNKKKLEKAIINCEKSSDISYKSKFLREAENVIIGSYALYPVIYETGYYVEAKGVEGVQFHMGTGRVSFVNATRKE